MEKNRAIYLIISKVVLLTCLTILSISCASTRKVNYKAYEKLPDKPSTTFYSMLAKSNPCMQKMVLYSNYGGPSNLGGLPFDEMDELFRRHDIVYLNVVTMDIMKAADEELVKRLEEIDPETLSEKGRKYRERAIKFFNSSLAELIGKPWFAGLWSREPEGSYFPDAAAVKRFFDPSHPGFPERPGTGAAGLTALALTAP